MSQDYYLSDNALVLEHTLIRLTGDSPHMRIPSVFGHQSVTTVGSGSLVLPKTEEVTFDRGYVRWNSSCMTGRNALKRVFFPETAESISPSMMYTNYLSDLEFYIDRALDAEPFHDLRQHAVPAGNQRYLLSPSLLKRENMAPVFCLMLNLSPAVPEITGAMGILFAGRIPGVSGSAWYSGTVFDPRPCFDFSGDSSEMEEYTAVMKMIRQQETGWHDANAEKKADLDIRFGQSRFQQGLRVSIAMCDAFPTTFGPDRKYHVRIHLFRQQLFFPALWPIRHQGKDWWVYSRNYLTGDKQCPYLREEVGVFDRDGLVTDRKTTEDVYAKYRLLSIL